MMGAKNTDGHRGFAVVALDDSKSGANLGGAIRAARCYGAAYVVASGRIARVNHPAAVKGYRHTPVLRANDVFDAVPFDCDTVAVDRVEGAVPIGEFKHPERAFYIFGGEDRTLSDDRVRACDHAIFVPTWLCMNLAATVNVVLYDRSRTYPLTRRLDNPEGLRILGGFSVCPNHRRSTNEAKHGSEHP